jgi:serine-type D-Ala-D-Ala carboxypeptidase
MMKLNIAEQILVRKSALANIAPLVQQSIAGGYYPGAVILAAHRGQIIYQGVFGNQQIAPVVKRMELSTIFDLASLTKVVVTTTAVMQLVEKGRICLDEKVAHYWPAFKQNGKEDLTIHGLLTHTSGLPANLPAWTGPDNYLSGIRQVEEIGLSNPPGKVFTYSDVNFIALGYLVELISGERLDQYANQHILQPLKMTATRFSPPPAWRDRIAPTSSPEDQQTRWGEVNDPTTLHMGGVTGVAGLFGTAEDLGIFLQCLLDRGRIQGEEYLLAPLSVALMTSPQTPPELPEVRGLGWDIRSRFSNRGSLLPLGSYGHTGWTGVSVWIDPHTQTWIIVLTSRTHPTLAKHNQLVRDRRAIADIIAASLIG